MQCCRPLIPTEERSREQTIIPKAGRSSLIPVECLATAGRCGKHAGQGESLSEVPRPASYLGTSNAPDSLLIWTRAMNDISLHDSFVAEGCAGLRNGRGPRLLNSEGGGVEGD